MCKLLVCKYGFFKKQKKSLCKLFPLWYGKCYRAQQLAAMLPFVPQLRNSCHATLPGCSMYKSQRRVITALHPPAFLFPTFLLLHRMRQNIYRICYKCVTGGISQSPLSVEWGVGWNTEFFTCGWFSVISIFQPKSQTSSLEKNDNWWQNPWHAVSSNANLG